MYMIEISDSKVSKMSEYVEDALHSMGRLMSCLEELEGKQHGYGHRDGGHMGRYGGYGYVNYREDKDWDEERESMGERRQRRDSRGRYM